MGFNSARYVHALYQVMNLAFADRDFYYGDPYYPPEEPLAGLISKDYAKARLKQVNWERNDPDVRPGDPYPFQGGANPFTKYLETWGKKRGSEAPAGPGPNAPRSFDEGFYAGTTSIEAADEAGWVVSVTPSGGWVPAVIAGRTGVGLSQRAQSFVLDPADGPYNVIEPGKRPRATLTPGLAMKDGKPYLAFAVQAATARTRTCCSSSSTWWSSG